MAGGKTAELPCEHCLYNCDCSLNGSISRRCCNASEQMWNLALMLNQQCWLCAVAVIELCVAKLVFVFGPSLQFLGALMISLVWDYGWRFLRFVCVLFMCVHVMCLHVCECVRVGVWAWG